MRITVLKGTRMGSLLALGTGQLLCYLYVASLGDVRINIIACEIGFFAAFLLYGTALALVQKNHHALQKSKPALLTILCLAICFRLCMWVSPPSLSDDIYRYLWEGKLVAAGINPFVHAPSDPSLAHLQDSAVYPRINHKEYPAIYPPLNQFIFALSTSISPTISAMNMTFILFDLLTMGLLILILRERQLPLSRIIIYAWNPLVIMEFAGSGHLDSAGICFLMLALYLFTKKWSWPPALALALSFLIKFIPLIFLPFLLIRRKALNLCIFCFTAILFYLPFVDAGKKLFESLLAYSEHWVFNASVYELILCSAVSPLQARGISLLALLLLAIMLFFHYAQKQRDEQVESIYYVGFVVMGGFLLLTPTLHPWYLCWMVPFLVIFPNWAWIYFTGSVFLSYLILKGYAEAGVWQENVVVKLAEYLPFYTLLLYDAARGYRARPSAGIISPGGEAGRSLFQPRPSRNTHEQ
jgi:alpha-1,6-mannosyltransferase